LNRQEFLIFSNIYSFICALMITIFCFRIRRMMNTKIADGIDGYGYFGSIGLNSIKTFVLNAFFLQFCFNRVIDERGEPIKKNLDN